MTRIGFRGKEKASGEWKYGWYLYVAEQDKHYILSGNIAKYPATPVHPHLIVEGFEWFEVTPETVGQYTSLKDKNGVKIFEGDIVRITEKINGNFIERVFTKKRICWQGGAFVFQSVDRDLSYPNLIRLNENETMEVIGNIHDNPELIEESE